jgi:hypothetical protein
VRIGAHPHAPKDAWQAPDAEDVARAIPRRIRSVFHIKRMCLLIIQQTNVAQLVCDLALLGVRCWRTYLVIPKLYDTMIPLFKIQIISFKKFQNKFVNVYKICVYNP